MSESSDTEKYFVPKKPREMLPSSKIPEVKHWGAALLVGDQKKKSPDTASPHDTNPGEATKSFLDKLAERKAMTEEPPPSSEAMPPASVLPFKPRKK